MRGFFLPKKFSKWCLVLSLFDAYQLKKKIFFLLEACLVPLGGFRSVAALVLLGSLGTVSGRAGYSIVKVQLKEAFIYSDICDPKSQGIRERFLKILSLIRKWGGGKVNPDSETFLKVPSLIPTFRPLFVNPVSEKTFETYSGDDYGYHLRGYFRI